MPLACNRIARTLRLSSLARRVLQAELNCRLCTRSSFHGGRCRLVFAKGGRACLNVAKAGRGYPMHSVAKVAVAIAFAVSGISRAAAATPTLLPHLSGPRAQYMLAHPDAMTKFLAQYARMSRPAPRAHRVTRSSGGKWELVTAGPTGLCNPLLLHDARVLVHDCLGSDWWILTPDKHGNYAKGKWKQAATPPVINGTQYAPEYFASAVLPDGQVIVEGGEYNNGVLQDTDDGAIYDPLFDEWLAVNPPTQIGVDQIGDAASVVLRSGVFMLAPCCGQPYQDYTLNETDLSWGTAAAPNETGQTYQDEQGYEMLPDGNVLTVDVWGSPDEVEEYTPSANTWSTVGNTPVSLVDPCGNDEIGPAVARGLTLVAFGGNTGCKAPTTDPTAIYDTGTQTWKAGPVVPSVCGSDGLTPCTLADAPAALLPSGNILFAASAGYGNAPTHFFEFTGHNRIVQVSDPVEDSNIPSSKYNFLELPNGQIFVTNGVIDPAEVYTPKGKTFAGYVPSITNVDTTLSIGTEYVLSGIQLNGRSQGAMYGDDAQAASNYPMLRITNGATRHVFYAYTYSYSTMSIAAKASGSFNFILPSRMETGASMLEVVANGVPSAPVNVTINP